jgi:hypothetical protein
LFYVKKKPTNNKNRKEYLLGEKIQRSNSKLVHIKKIIVSEINADIVSFLTMIITHVFYVTTI